MGDNLISPIHTIDRKRLLNFSITIAMLYTLIFLLCYSTSLLSYTSRSDLRPQLLQDQRQIINKQLIYQSTYLPIVSPIPQAKKFLLVLCSTLYSTMLTEDIEIFFKYYSTLEEKYSFRMIVFSQAPLIRKIGKQYDIRVVSYLKLNEYKKPVFPYLMETTENLVESSFYGYINGDILLSETVFSFLQTMLSNQNGHRLFHPGCLFAGRVSEVANVAEFNEAPQNAADFFDSLYYQGSLRNRFSSDYFIYHGLLYSIHPEQYDGVVLGRYYIDNWIMGSILVNDGFLVDTTNAIHGIHMGSDTFRKKAFRTWVSIKDFYYNKRITRPNFPWTSLVYSNYTTYWSKSFLVLEKNI